MTTIKDLAALIEGLREEISKLKAEITSKDTGPTDNTALESLGAKIIKELSDKMDKCECTERLKKELQEQPDKGKQIVSPDKQESSTPSSNFTRYSYPNWNVGNASLGSSGNPDALKWPPV
ncbi:minor capsid protein [Dahlia mosaic virus]|uniref:Virion-associated protein n=1 Tax=Dahlia mosaic virus TaxID=213888 RepID=Q7THB6_DMV|nr:minor capsid protein [Dahlia mosaic virus]AAP44109.1 putative DNA-binding protein/minor viral capsid protein [Dahlia mosaic virus]AFR69281.1 minor capsid protein [Dahlia mosaic virus]